MRVLIFFLIILISINLSASFNIPMNRTDFNIAENFSNKVTFIKSNEPITKSIKTQYEIKPGEKLNIYNMNGCIKLIGWDEDHIKIVAIKIVYQNCKNLNDLHMTLDTLNGLNIETVNCLKDNRARIDYIINIPKDTLIGEIYSKKNILYKDLPDKILNNIRVLSNR
jgi:hypothetical protein